MATMTSLRLNEKNAIEFARAMNIGMAEWTIRALKTESSPGYNAEKTIGMMTIVYNYLGSFWVFRFTSVSTESKQDNGRCVHDFPVGMHCSE